MASRGAATPVHSSNASAAWCTSMPRPLAHGHPAEAGGSEQRRLHRVVHRVDHELTGVEAFGVDGRRLALHTERRGVHDQRERARVAPVEAGALDRAARAPPRRRGRRDAAGRDGDRRRRHRPARGRWPGPRRRRRARARAGGGVDPVVAHRPEEALAVGRCAEKAAAVTRDDGVDGAQRGSCRRQVVARGRSILLVGHGHAQAAEAQRAHGRRAASAPRPLGTSNAQNTQSSPAAANPALWMAGEREWRIGSPITAATRVEPRGVLTRPVPRSCGCSARDPAGSPRTASYRRRP